jgi:hypothetical protein
MTAIAHPVSPEELMAYLDGELGTNEAAAVHAHVGACASCARLRGELAALSPQLGAWTVERAPDSLRPPRPSPPSSVLAWLRARTMRHNRAAVFQVAVVAVLLVVVAFVMPRRRAHTTVPTAATETIPVRVGGSPRLEAETPVRAGGAAGTAVGRAAVGAAQVEAPAVGGQRLIVRTASLVILTREFDQARAAIDRVVAELGGFLGGMTVIGAPGEPRVLNATLRIPAAQLASAMAALKPRGHVAEESQQGTDVTERARDINARLSNARAAERRLVDLLSRRSGDLADVLAAEREITRVREQIEQLDAERQGLGQQVTYATLALRITEQRQAALTVGPSPMAWRFRDALIDGTRGALDSGVSAALFLVRVLPFVALWALIVVPAAVLIRRRSRPRTPVSAPQ